MFSLILKLNFDEQSCWTILQQIVDDLTLATMTQHDLPVDIIVTPKRIVNVRNRKQIQFKEFLN